MAYSCRTAFISDVHLGTAECQTDLLLEFLRQLRCDRLYLVGDIIDLQALHAGSRWTAAHAGIVEQIFALAEQGMDIVYLPGNHDAALRPYAGLSVRGVRIALEAEHACIDGRRLRVSHGDEFDPEHIGRSWLTWLGEHAHRALCWAHVGVNRARRRLRMDYLPLSIIAKTRIGLAMQYISGFEQRVALHAADAGFDGQVCGHIHYGHIRRFGDFTYMNDGDWVEHCTALIEHHDGRFELLPWRRSAEGNEPSRRSPRRPAVIGQQA